MADKIKKTNAMRILDKAKIPYDALSYQCDDDHLDGVFVSEQIGLPVSQVYKTLVTKGGKDRIVCLLAVDQTLNLKALAASAGIKKLEMIPVKDITTLTGYIRGGCSPLGMKKDYPTFIDESVLKEKQIAISAGVRGQQILLSPADLIAVRQMTVGAFTMEGTE